NARSARAFFRCGFDSPPAPPRPRRRTGHDIDAFAHWPQVHDIGGDPREAVVVLADPAAFIAVDATGEGHFAIRLERPRVVEAVAAGDETTADIVGRPVRPAGGAQPGRDHLEAGAVGFRLDLHDATTPSPHRTGAVGTGGIARTDLRVLALQRFR